ncbi:MAG: hypothetical protein U5R14_04730 [Gemmatimonadota bacterium]|nr:hypothetical protein [Gemmatimonadota bacterium]
MPSDDFRTLRPMHCTTCGEAIEPGEDRCTTCGAVAPAARIVGHADRVRACPRCAYQGEGVPYFRRAGHVALLVGVSVFTYGIGGLVYWLVRRHHLVCPRCGLGWENAARVMSVAGPEAEQHLSNGKGALDEPLPSAGLKRRIGGVAMVLLATLLVLVGIVEGEAAAVALGSVVGVGGSLTFYWGWRGLQDRRHAVLRGLQRRVLHLAAEKGGTLTVTEAAAELNLSLSAAERILTGMDDDFRVRSEISREGVLYYEFPELRHRGDLGPGV